MTVYEELVDSICSKRASQSEPDRITLTRHEFWQLVTEIRTIGTWLRQADELDYIYLLGIQIDHD